MQIKKLLVFCIALLIFCVPSTNAAARLKIVSNSKSTFAIVIASDAPSSVKNAAEELQKDIRIATGALLPIQKDTVQVAGSFISLGETEQAKIAGISNAGIKDDGYRIVTQDGNLYIWGADTADGSWTEAGGVSSGTANGVYTFLEDYLNVRWLMPGDIGRDVPAKSTFILDEIDRTEAPLFTWREVSHLQDFANPTQVQLASQWRDHLRLGISTLVTHDPRWWQILEKYPTNDSLTKDSVRVDIKKKADPRNDLRTPPILSAYHDHPEWFAMDSSGKRPFPNSIQAKLETTDQGLVQFFADQVVDSLKNNKRPVTFSLSPTDGSGWSLSPESKALYDPSAKVVRGDTETKAGQPSMSSLVIKWYNDVAQIVLKEYPEARLSGYLYASYTSPPVTLKSKLPNNFTPVIATSGTYGYALYERSSQEYFKNVTDSWARVIPGAWYSYIDTQFLRQWAAEVGIDNFPGTTGIITPAAPDIWNTYFHQLVKSGIKGGKTYGVPSWSNAALANYILAKMQWDPTQDAEEVQREWLHRAYGDKAGTVMEDFYQRLNGWMRDYYQQKPDHANVVTLDRLHKVYGVHYPQMETLFLNAMAQPMTDVEKQRLQLLENNLIVLQWRLQNMRYLPDGFTSKLQRTDTEIHDLLTKENTDFQLFPGAIAQDWTKRRGFFRAIPKVTPTAWKIQTKNSNEAPLEQSFPPKSELDDGQFLLYAKKDQDIRITTKMVSHNAFFGTYTIKDKSGEIIRSGLLDTAEPFTIPAKSGEFYIVYISLRKAVNYEIQVDNAMVASASFEKNILTLYGDSSPVYVLAAPQSPPIGIFDEEGNVTAKYPYSGAMMRTKMKTYTEKRLLNTLDEGWVFSPDPQDSLMEQGVTKTNFDDSSWMPISPYDWWQFQGFSDYRGVGWYRVKFTGKELKKGESARLYFGAVDGNTEVYLNDKKIAEHLLGPDGKGWNAAFSTVISGSGGMIQNRENILAVKVTSKPIGSSGIIGGVAIIAGYPPRD